LLVNVHSDHVLRALRAPGESGYKVPFGGAFTYVSAPNYLAEIVEWLGFALAAQTLAAWAFAAFTFANLAPRALANHRWYREKFPEYPARRRALIPFLW
jgi:3-oxo-5-alpha-steroid 4-dehydrogenase 1